MLRALPLLALVGCSSTPVDYIEAHGAFADGTAIDVRFTGATAMTTSVQPQLGPVEALTTHGSAPETLVGLLMEWMPQEVQVGTAYPSTPTGPVIFYVSQPKPDGGTGDLELSVVNGGAITFTDNRRTATGTLQNLVLARGGQTILTLASGSFQATNP